MRTHPFAHLRPHGQQHALPLVIARAVLVRFAEIAGDDGPVNRAHNLTQGDLLGRPSQDVATPDPSLGTHQTGALQGEENLLEVGLGQTGALGDVANRRRLAGTRVQGERQ